MGWRRSRVAALPPAALAAAVLLVGVAGAHDWKDEDVEGTFALHGTQGGRPVLATLTVRKARPGDGFLVTRRAYDKESGAATVLHGTGERQGSELTVELQAPAGIVGAIAGPQSKKTIKGSYEFDDAGASLAGELDWKAVRERGERPEKTLELGPAVQDVHATSAVVLWRTKKKTEGAVEFGATPALGKTVKSARGERHQVALDGLAGRCFYRVLVDGDAATPIESFETAAAPGTSFTISVFGDSGTGGKDQRAVAQRLAHEEAAFTIHGGDILYPKGTRDKDTWIEKYFDPYKDLVRSRCVFPTFGNHEAEEPRGFDDNFVVPSNNPAKTSRYYSYEWGDARFVHVDTSGLEFRDTDQKKWLKGQLASNTRRWLVLVSHVPLRSSGEEGDVRAVREGLKPIIEGLPVDLILTAHKHRYERAKVAGALQIISGGGGADLSDVDENDNDIEKAVKANHHVTLTFSPSRIRGRAVDADGREIDAFSLDK